MKINTILFNSFWLECKSFVTLKNKFSFSVFEKFSPCVNKQIKFVNVSRQRQEFKCLSLNADAECKTNSFLRSSYFAKGFNFNYKLCEVFYLVLIFLLAVFVLLSSLNLKLSIFLYVIFLFFYFNKCKKFDLYVKYLNFINSINNNISFKFIVLQESIK